MSSVATTPAVRESPSRGLARDARSAVWLLIGAGLIVRAILAFKTYGVIYDIGSFKAVGAALNGPHPFDVYSAVNGHPFNRWPYGPMFFPWLAAAGHLANATGLHVSGWFKLPQVLADCAIAWFVQDYLRAHGARDRVRLAAVALVALGASFWIISGYHGQIDSVAILPAVAALWLWDREPAGTRRAVAAGVLIGLGASTKTVPIVMLLALLPSARSGREAATLIACAVAIPLVVLAPFLVADAHGTIHALRSHRALPGVGGISLLAQPSLANIWLHHQNVRLSSLSHFLLDKEPLILAVLIAPLVVLTFVRRPRPAVAAALLWFGVLVFSVGFGFEYVVWALPFALMAGYVWQVAAVQAALLLPEVILYWHPFGHAPTAVYVPVMIGIWCALLAVLVAMGLRLARRTLRA